MTREAGRLRILIIEDEQRYRALLEREISAMGHRCTSCGRAEEALQHLECADFDAALVDLNLPGMNGMQFFEHVRECRPQLLVIILTGVGDMETVIQALRWEAVDFLTKPCGLDEIERALAKVQLLIRERAELSLPSQTRPDGQEPATTELGTNVAPPSPDEQRSLADLEREHILAALGRHHGHKPAVAAELGISLRTLYNRLAAYRAQGHLPSNFDGP